MVGGTYPLKSRRIVVTGAGRGLGRAIAAACLGAGADLLLLARRTGDVPAELVEACHPGQLIQTAGIDLGDTAAAASIVKRYAPDVLINNAAEQGPIGPLWTLDAAEWRHAVEIDLVVPAMLSAAAIPSMIARGGGAIINIGGGGGVGSRPNFSAYAAAKAGLIRLTECVADEVRDHGIAVTAVAPGPLPTRMLERIAADPRAGEAEIAHARRGLDMPADLAERALRDVAEFCIHLAEQPRLELSGRLIGPRWDDWRDVANFGRDVFTLRRVEPPGEIRL